MYLGNGLVITAAHVPGNFEDTKPHVLIGGEDRPQVLVRQGSLDGVDLTLLSVDPNALPVRMRMRRLPLCETAPVRGRKRRCRHTGKRGSLPCPSPPAVPEASAGAVCNCHRRRRDDRQFGFGSDRLRQTCLLGIISRKISIRRPGVHVGARRRPGTSPSISCLSRYPRIHSRGSFLLARPLWRRPWLRKRIRLTAC